KTLAKGTLGTVAAGAMALATAAPAAADDYRDRGGIGAEEIIAGAVVIGGIAALAGAFDGDKRDRYRDRRYHKTHYRGDRRGYKRGFNNPRRAVQRCINAAERQAQRFGGWRFADVTQIRDVDRTRYGFRVKGRIQVEGNRGYRGRNFDRGRFTCYFDGQGRPEIRFRNLRGLR
ncbi:MAG: hypothetical protein AAF941_00830, partial [Pseudomonadota bacterium]